MKTENFDLEYKEMYVDDINKEVIAFTNTEGGTLYIGIRKDGTIVGVDDPDETMLRVTSNLNDSIMPNVMPFVQIRSEEMDGCTVVRIDVSVGTDRPYYIGRKGLRPEGVYVRRGSAKIPLSHEGIRKMISDSYGESFERRRSMNQELTFKSFYEEMDVRNIDVSSAEKFKILHLVGDDDLYTNLGLLLSDQCPNTLKIAVFEGESKETFLDRREFTGSVLKQLEDGYAFIQLMNKTKATFSGLRREDRRDYPDAAIREALLNAIVHRDYSMGGSTIVNIYDEHIEFISLGGLVDGISLDAIYMGASVSRNPALANIFYRMKLIESYGTGVRKIRDLYSAFEKKPEFEAAQGAFRVTLYNMNCTFEQSETDLERIKQNEDERNRIIDAVRESGSITRKDVEILLGAGQTKAYSILNELVMNGQLVQIRAGKKTIYQLAE